MFADAKMMGRLEAAIIDEFPGWSCNTFPFFETTLSFAYKRLAPTSPMCAVLVEMFCWAMTEGEAMEDAVKMANENKILPQQFLVDVAVLCALHPTRKDMFEAPYFKTCAYTIVTLPIQDALRHRGNQVTSIVMLTSAQNRLKSNILERA